jgi:microcystin-dependent protein
MSTPYLGEIRIVSFNFAPKGWALCNGQLLPINQNQALFALFGTTYGGNGQTNFALPNLQGRVPIHFGNGISLGEAAGQENTTLILSQLPTHNHSVNAANTTTGNVTNPTNGFFSNSAPPQIYSAGAPSATFQPTTISATGGSQPHNNMQPSLVLNMIVALQGIFPSPN